MSPYPLYVYTSPMSPIYPHLHKGDKGDKVCIPCARARGCLFLTRAACAAESCARTGHEQVARTGCLRVLEGQRHAIAPGAWVGATLAVPAPSARPARARPGQRDANLQCQVTSARAAGYACRHPLAVFSKPLVLGRLSVRGDAVSESVACGAESESQTARVLRDEHRAPNSPGCGLCEGVDGRTGHSHADGGHPAPSRKFLPGPG
jgi:hypothetical protein